MQQRLGQVQPAAQNIQPTPDQVERPGGFHRIGAAAQHQRAAQFGIKATPPDEHLIGRVHPQVQRIARPTPRCRLTARHLPGALAGFTACGGLTDMLQPRQRAIGAESGRGNTQFGPAKVHGSRDQRRAQNRPG